MIVCMSCGQVNTKWKCSEKGLGEYFHTYTLLLYALICIKWAPTCAALCLHLYLIGRLSCIPILSCQKSQNFQVSRIPFYMYKNVVRNRTASQEQPIYCKGQKIIFNLKSPEVKIIPENIIFQNIGHDVLFSYTCIYVYILK